MEAIAVFQKGPLEGFVMFKENKVTTTITTYIRGLSKGSHGIHIHERKPFRRRMCKGMRALQPI